MNSQTSSFSKQHQIQHTHHILESWMRHHSPIQSPMTLHDPRASHTSRTAPNPCRPQRSKSRSSISSRNSKLTCTTSFINNQLQLEADAREALPYVYDTITTLRRVD